MDVFVFHGERERRMCVVVFYFKVVSVSSVMMFLMFVATTHILYVCAWCACESYVKYSFKLTLFFYVLWFLFKYCWQCFLVSIKNDGQFRIIILIYYIILIIIIIIIIIKHL